MLDITPQWQTVTTYLGAAYSLKQDDKLPDYILALTKGTLAYEQAIKAAWIDFKRQPTETNARKFANFLKTYSGKHWPEVVKSVLGVPELSPQQQKMLEDALGEHHEYVMTSLLPDILKAASADNLNAMDHRAIFLYAGALWSFGLLATVMFDGLEVRDLADLFLFAGPNDPATCTGERGCEQYAGKVLTVAQILAGDIIPGHLRCVTNCRHMLLPIASPLNKPKVPKPAMDYGQWQSEFKHLAGRHDQHTHAPRALPGNRIESIEELNEFLRGGELIKPASKEQSGYILNPKNPDDLFTAIDNSKPGWRGKVAAIFGIYDNETGSLSFPLDPYAGHEELVAALTNENRKGNERFSTLRTRTTFLDRSVHVELDFDYEGNLRRLKMDADIAGAVDNPDLAVRNIYKAMDALSDWGLPNDTPVRIQGYNVQEFDTTLKHLPGEHDQLDHGRRSGASHATVSREWLTSQHVLAGDYGKPGSSQDDLADTLSKYEVSQEDLAGLRSITDAPPDGYHYANGVMRKTTGAGLLGGDIYGVYDPKTSTLHISPAVLATDSGKKTLLHEIGHHVSQKHAEDESAYVAWERILKEAPTHIEGTEFVRDTSKLQRKYGLRENSIQGTDELLADSYMASKMGSKAQKAALEALWQDAGTPLQEVLKELGDVIAVTELRPIVDNGQVAIVGVPVKVSAELVRATPWYYLEEVVLKHLPGRHDQKSHAPGGIRRLSAPLRPFTLSEEHATQVDVKAVNAYFEDVTVFDRRLEVGEDWTTEDITVTSPKIGPDPESASVELHDLMPDNLERSRWKRFVADALANDTGIPIDRVGILIRTWADTSNDENPRSLGMQMAASEEFGAPLSEWQERKIAKYEVKILNGEEGPEIEDNYGVKASDVQRYKDAKEDGHKVLRAMYNRTQKELKAAGIDGVTLYRGSTYIPKNYEDKRFKMEEVELSENAMESWSLSFGTARSFSDTNYQSEEATGIVLQARVPRERILCYPKTGFGCLTEFEYVVLGSDTVDTATVVEAEQW